MTADEKIKEALRNFNKQGALTLTGTVKTVNETKAICTVDLGDDFIIDDVRLRATESDDKGFICIPAVDSVVFMLRLATSDDFFIVGFSEIDKLIFKNDDRSFEINKEKIIFNDGALDSYMPDINALVEKINTLEQDLNSVKQVFTTWVPVPQDGGASLKTASATWAAQTITETTVNDIKDDTIEN